MNDWWMTFYLVMFSYRWKWSVVIRAVWSLVLHHLHALLDALGDWWGYPQAVTVAWAELARFSKIVISSALGMGFPTQCEFDTAFHSRPLLLNTWCSSKQPWRKVRWLPSKRLSSWLANATQVARRYVSLHFGTLSIPPHWPAESFEYVVGRTSFGDDHACSVNIFS